MTILKIDGIQTLGENIADNGGIKEAYRVQKKTLFINWLNRFILGKFLFILKALKTWEKDHKMKEQTLPGINFTSNQMFFIGAAQVWCAKATNEALLTQMLLNPHSVPHYRCNFFYYKPY